ncbi:MAG TPA: S41 family peptidase [Bdellovibrionales bacterium]|nr:S41 family peptidase [Bdellovibrionales bacterium]
MRFLSLLLLPLALQANAQFQRAQSLELSCVHLYPIQIKYLEKHVNFSKLSKNLETRTVEQFIKRLDGSKLYLLDKDVKDIEKMMANIFDKTKNKDCSALEKANTMFVKRVEERVAYAKKFLGGKFKYDPTVKIQRDPQDRPRPKTLAEANKFHETYMQYQVASYLATDMKMDEAKQQIIRNYERALKRVQEFKKEDLLSSYIDSFARALDPHSSYLSADALEDFEIQMRLSLEGIGATLSSQDGFTVIEQLIPGGAADASGKLKVKDRILAVGQGKEGPFTNVIEMELRDVVKLIRGPKGSDVRLKVLRKSAKEPLNFELKLVRDKIKLEDEAAALTYMDREVNGQKLKIGLLNLPSFYADNRKNGPSAAGDMKKLLVDAAKNKADAIVLDLSNNGGGSLRDAVDIAGLFYATGNVVKQSQRVTSELEQVQYETLRDTDSTVDWAGPLVVLTSRVSASASEIVSGTLQDYKRAIVVGGDHTFGKGSVQSVEYLPLGLGAIKTTVGMFFTAGGASTQHQGVSADIIYPSTFAIDEIGEKTLDYSLPPKKIKEFLSPTAYVTEGKGSWIPLNKDIEKKLNEKSLARVAASTEFKKIRDELEKSKKRGKMIVVGDLVKDKEKDKDGKKKIDPETGEPNDDETATLTREERKKKYFERADVVEAINVAADLALELKSPTMQLGSKGKAAGSAANDVAAPDSTSN